MDWVISYENFCFKNIIDKIRSDVLCSNITHVVVFSERKLGFPSGNLTKFSKTIYKIMNKVGDNIILTGLNYELFYKSILKLSDCFEGIMYKFNQKCISRKNKRIFKNGK